MLTQWRFKTKRACSFHLGFWNKYSQHVLQRTCANLQSFPITWILILLQFQRCSQLASQWTACWCSLPLSWLQLVTYHFRNSSSSLHTEQVIEEQSWASCIWGRCESEWEVSTDTPHSHTHMVVLHVKWHTLNNQTIGYWWDVSELDLLRGLESLLPVLLDSSCRKLFVDKERLDAQVTS